MADSESIDYGPCCACGRTDGPVRTLVMLQKLAPVPGTGWGCIVCNLPPDGAMAILCDACAESAASIKFPTQIFTTAISGRPDKKERIAFKELKGFFCHDAQKHKGERS